MAMEQPESAGASSRDTAATCYWHPEAETGLSCSRCGKNICTNCLVQAPVGLRCRECGKAQPMPTYDVQPVHYARGVVAAIALAIAGGVLWAVLDRIVFGLGGFGPVSELLAIPFGYAAGDIISRAVNRKRSAPLSYIAALTVVAGFILSRLIHLVLGSAAGFDFMWTILFLAFGAYLAWQRLRR